ncbi:glycoside hydrolase family 5 protein [Methyloceanibacter sp.]|uniref:glycoside hydrolase family 5 protein n=1 Tax=Methyloceanibacter sp. TaxID=1965321 RepID=UPI002D281B46|nr:glycoside hydrolase family 5 protein [Methyloceanibacter sp.]HZP08101.1 glycoside hydrolase family 5 protein [Methyloceanibacter sp.]
MRLRIATGLVALAGLLALALCGVVQQAKAESGAIALKRGVSIHEWLNWSPVTPSGVYQWPPYRPLEAWGGVQDFERIKAMGFDFVRLSVDPGPLLASDQDHLAQALALLKNDIGTVTATGLKVVLDLHPVSQVKSWSAAAIEVSPLVADRYRNVVAATAAMLEDAGTDRVALELMNEPQFYPCDGDGGRDWEAMVRGLVRAAREAAPTLTLVVTGACGGNVTGLVQLDPARLNDDKLLYSFHFYEPLPFTHEGKSTWSADMIAARFDQVRAWAKENGVPPSRLFLGEFGVTAAGKDHSSVPDKDRFAWLDAVRRAGEGLGAAWCYWEYSNPYGMSLTTFDRSRRPDPVALAALNLNNPPVDSVGN